MENTEGVKMIPKVHMIPTLPKLTTEQVQIFSTQKILANQPSFMFEKINDPTQLGIVPFAVKPFSLSLFAPENPDLVDVKKDKRIQDFVNMSAPEKYDLTCDEVFVLYLGNISKQVNAVYYRTVMKFVLLYRDCLN